MRNLPLFYFLIFTLFIRSQDFKLDLSSSKSDALAYTTSHRLNIEDVEVFEKVAETYAVPQRTFTNINEAQNGYYVIAGVFKQSKNLRSEVIKLNKRGFKSGYFHNPNTELYYLYLNHYSSWQNALYDSNSKFDNQYKNDVWVLKIINDAPVEQLVPLEKINSQAEPSSMKTEKIASTSLDSKSRLVQRADTYFNKMRYAEAAKLYELALANDDQRYTFDVLQKAGDAHYFDANMEKAYKWYNILYEKYGDEISSGTLFKYAHSLKGMGNYKRSKRLMNLYNKRFKGAQKEQNKIIIDRLLKTKDSFNVDNLKVNSKYSEFSPMFYNGDELVFASSKDTAVFNTRRYKFNGQPFLDLYVAKVNAETQELKDAIKFSRKINTKYHEASVTFSPDNETMYFTRNNYGKKLKRDQNGINNLKIYRSKKINGEWEKAEEVSFNSDSYSTGHPALSKDGKQLYFVSDMPGSIGETDIFVVDVLENGSFSSPRNLGPEINTEQKEMFPFINDKKLYFSSNGHMGLGGLDIFEVAFDTEKGFSGVRNLGKPVNSEKDDFSFIINEETQKGYFASNRPGGKGDDDIYSFQKLQIEETPTAKSAIAGVVTELVSGANMPNALVQLLDENNIKLKEMETDENGTFVFEELESQTRYVLKTSKGSYDHGTIEVETKENDVVHIDVPLRKLNEMVIVENGIRKLKTEMIHFNFDESRIREEAALELDKLVAVMKESPNMVIKIESHTDSRGAAVYNKYLSEKRAKSTKEYIIAQGIDPKRIQSAIGYGEERLLNECDGSIYCKEAQHFLNRRSAFIIVDI